MLDLVAENPWVSIGAGIVGELVLLALLVTTGRRAFLGLIAGVLVLAALGVMIERWVVTDREQIVELFDRGAQYALAHDVNGLLSLVDPSASELQRDIRRGMTQVKVDSLAITSLEVKVDRQASPPTATADLFLKFRLNAPREQLPNNDLHGRWLVRLHKISGHWRVVSAESKDLL